MNLGDIIYLSDNKEKKYIIVSLKEINEKYYALITEFDATINIKERSIKNIDVDLTKTIAISKDKLTEKIEFVEDEKIISELCNIIYPN